MQNAQQKPAQFAPPTSVEDEQAIRQIVQSLEDAWNTGDAEAWSAHNADGIIRQRPKTAVSLPTQLSLR
jgi:hypothetical protein